MNRAAWLMGAFIGWVSLTATVGAQVVEGPWSSIEANVARRDFYGLVEMEQRPLLMGALSNDKQLEAVHQRHAEALKQALSACKDAPCLDAAIRWSDADITEAGAALRRLAAADVVMRAYIQHELRGSGNFVLYAKDADGDLLNAMWMDAAQSMNRIVNVYGDGQPPRYARIDSTRYGATSPEYVEALHAIGAMVAQEDNRQMAFFFPEMKYAVMLLASNGRLDAGRYEPLDKGANAEAVRRAKTIRWSKYPYSVLLVPGEGPELPEVELSPLGRIRVEIAVRLFREGKAPFILVSGGTVHPMLTHFCEAMEMRKELIDEWGVPADAIMVDPYARHTTTNLRNAVREVVRYGLPVDKPMLIATDQAQAAMILKPAFDTRCMAEMHLRPWLSLDALSATEIEMMPNRDSLQEDATDPMDP